MKTPKGHFEINWPLVYFVCIVLFNFLFFRFCNRLVQECNCLQDRQQSFPPKKWKVLPRLNGLKMYAHCCPRPWPRLTWLIEPRPIPSTFNVTSWGIRPKNQNVCDHPLLPLLPKKSSTYFEAFLIIQQFWYDNQFRLVVVSYVLHRLINISSVVEFQRWWVLKSKIFGQESTY